MIKSATYIIIAILSLSSYPLDAQQMNTVIPFTQGLVLKRPGGRNAAVRADPVEYSMVTGTWKTPVSGDPVIFGDTTVFWESIAVDETGWFSDPVGRGAYLLVVINSEEDRIMLLEENGNDCVYVNGQLRVGNRYGTKDNYESWEPNFNYTILPVQLKKGNNEFLFYVTRAGRLKAGVHTPDASASFNIKDATLPDFIIGEAIDTRGAVVVINNSRTVLDSYTIESRVADHDPVTTKIPVIPPLTIRKVGFQMTGAAPKSPGEVPVHLKLLDPQNNLISSTTIQIKIRQPLEAHKRTFISTIDGSVQYYAVNPAQKNTDKSKALVLSVHGAAVEAINQASSYYGKTWAHIVAPTNRRPYGFNWEDWGRLDAMEVLTIAQTTLATDPGRVYLTGHSMGGHGSWHLGATFPDKFAAIGPSAGWLSFWSYRERESERERSPLQQMLMRATSPSNTLALAENYKQHGVYIIHGEKDDNVRVDQSRQMVEHLEKFHKDYIYHEEPGQGHWWDISDEPGSDCVDWAPLFDFFARHTRPEKERVRQVEFITASPGISAQNNWLAIEAQEKQLSFSKVNIRFDPGKRRFAGTTENVVRLSFDLSLLEGQDTVLFDLDNQKVEHVEVPEDRDRIWLEKSDGRWNVALKPLPSVKGPHRYGTFKDVFKNCFMLVYGTKGTAEENAWALAKATYDAEYFWYQGNGSIDIIPDAEFDPKQEVDRNVILYGNAETNSAWQALLNNSPVQVGRGMIKISNKKLMGDDQACLLIRPRPGSDIASVGAISGTGIAGMRATNRRPYLSPGYSYPDVTIFTPEIILNPDKGVKMAGFFGLDWKLESGEIVWETSVK